MSKRIRAQLGAVAIAIGVTLLLTGCPTSTSASNGSGSGAQAPVASAPAEPAATLTSSKQWSSNGCLGDYVMAGSRVVSYRATKLCRIADPSGNSTGTFYYLVEQGRPSSAWVMEVGVGNDGYSYWTFPRSDWFRQGSGGVELQVKNTATGSLSYENYDAWLSSTSQNNFIQGVTFEIAQSAGLQNVAAYEAENADAAVTVTKPDATPVESSQAETQLQQSQALIQQQQQQLKDDQQKLQQAQQPSDKVSASDVQAYLTQQNANTVRIAAEAECDDSFNGCAP